MLKKPKVVAVILVICISLFVLLWLVSGSVHNVSALAFSPDGRSLAAGGGWLEPHDGTRLSGAAWVWDAETGELKQSMSSLGKHVDWIAYSPDSGSLATWQSEEEKYILWDAKTYQQLKESRVAGPDRFTISLAKRWLPDSEVRSWPTLIGRLQRMVKFASTEQLEPVAVSANGKVAAFVNSKPGIQIWNLATGKMLRQIKYQGNSTESTALSSDGSTLAVESSNLPEYELWNVGSGKLVQTLKLQNQSQDLIVFSPDGNKLATADVYGSIEVWDAHSGKRLTSMQAN